MTAASAASGVRLLVVDDDPTNRALVRAVLGRSAAVGLEIETVREASTLAEARAALKAGPTDAIVLDVRLPDGSGLDLAREVAVVDGGVRPRVLVMSASVLPEQRAAALATGADAFLAKPFRPAELLALLVDLTGSRRQQPTT